LNIARLYYRNGLYEKAGAHFARASALKPSDADIDRGLAAATSLARIQANSKNPLEEKEACPTPKAEKQVARYDVDGFYTIPAGAIEDLEIIKTDLINLAEKSYDFSKEDDQPIYTVTLARIASKEEERARTRKTLEAKRLKILDEDQALELLDLKAADAVKRSGTRVKIEVSNGNGVRHMARRVGNYLRDKGFILINLSNASHFNHDGTSIYYAKGYLREAYRLSQELPGFQSLEEVPVIRNKNAKISILIGRDLTDYLSLFEQG